MSFEYFGPESLLCEGFVPSSFDLIPNFMSHDYPGSDFIAFRPLKLTGLLP